MEAAGDARLQWWAGGPRLHFLWPWRRSTGCGRPQKVVPECCGQPPILKNDRNTQKISLRADMLMIETSFCQHSLCAQRFQVRVDFVLIAFVLWTVLSERLIQSTIWTWIAPQRAHIEKKQTWVLHRHNWQFCKTLLDATFIFESFPFYLPKNISTKTLALF